MNPMLNVAIQAVREASHVIVKSLERLDHLNVSEKGHNDFVSEVDQIAEQKIIEVLLKTYPDHKIIAEEGGIVSEGSDNYTWIIDPLDGTTNYLHGLPHFAISVAVMYKDKFEYAVVYDPLMQEWFTASRGGGAFLNDRRIRVSSEKRLSNALIGTGFPFRNPQHFKPYMNTFEAIFPKTSGVRRAGSAALDLAYVAAGRLDGFWEMSLKPWDIAAGALLIKEAGGILSDFGGEPNYMDSGQVVAGNPKVYKALLQMIQSNLEKG